MGVLASCSQGQERQIGARKTTETSSADGQILLYDVHWAEPGNSLLLFD
jgi:hypothetical protein